MRVSMSFDGQRALDPHQDVVHIGRTSSMEESGQYVLHELHEVAWRAGQPERQSAVFVLGVRRHEGCDFSAAIVCDFEGVEGAGQIEGAEPCRPPWSRPLPAHQRYTRW